MNHKRRRLSIFLNRFGENYWTRGFSLIEVMVTLAIIGIITSVVVPNYTKLQEKAKESSLKSLAYSIQMGIESYHLHKGAYPSGTNVGLVSLINKLIESKDFSKMPINVFTGSPYTSADKKGQIVYSKTSKGYSLFIYGADATFTIETLTNF